MIQQPADYSCCEGASSRFGQRNIATRRIDVTSSWGKSRSAYRTSLTMPARVKNFVLYFLFSLSFFGHTTPFTPKSGLIGSVKLCFSDHGSLVIFRSASVRSKHLFDPYFDHDYLFKLPLTRERDAPSTARCFTSHHVRYRAVPRTNRTLTTANTHNHSATSSTTESPACVPSLLWQCSCADASPGACTDAASQDESAPLLAPPPPTRSATTNCLAC